MDNNRIFGEIKELIASRQCVAFVGAGLSNGVYPTWERVVENVCKRCRVNFSRSDVETERRQERADLLMELADQALRADPVQYKDALRRLFGRPPALTRRAYDLLARTQFSSYITTNFDPLLALALDSHKTEFPYDGVYAYPDLPFNKVENRAAYYIHGRISEDGDFQAEHVILAKSAFWKAYSGRKGTLNSFLEQLLVYKDLVFLGCSLQDPFFTDFLQRCEELRREMIKDRPASTLRRRYALLPRENRERTAEAMLSQTEGAAGKDGRTLDWTVDEAAEHERLLEMSIEAVFFDPEDRECRGLDKIIERWCEAGPIPTKHSF